MNRRYIIKPQQNTGQLLLHARACPNMYFASSLSIYLLCATGLLFLARAQACIFELAAGAEPIFHGMFIYLSQGLGDWSLNINMCWGILASWPRPDRFGSSLSSYITLMPFHIIFPVTVCYIFSFGPGPPCILHSGKAYRKKNVSLQYKGNQKVSKNSLINC